ncbi:putative xyloglucan-specific endo-beta-1,4-glucanase A [Neolecta irregularis DAH-3]|uniref:Putative xyloglucan-specific endo-beta-1,4-glucanase A n=1 Tax=Neolecta irregularis (strain DAH-3) TaxID=1198029 RepID=A0A1U7LPC4_NEOID|nr:putative xyloglucan-specific endo-beta-1,4-glucanase A [Neolecta irregularis DAH-3]|eukprot:OLL24478.1 putative xyloglucan-specific endo-beta-1,4-glucanase A [Neolecta irregularis DAH-3]
MNGIPLMLDPTQSIIIFGVKATTKAISVSQSMRHTQIRFLGLVCGSGGVVQGSYNSSSLLIPSQVKSFSNAVLKQASPQEVSIIHSIPSSWTWSYEGNAVDADVAYDMFFSPTENSEASVEVMIWLGALGGAGPIWDGATTWNVTIGAHNWTLYHGVNKYQSNFALNVYSFIRNDATGDIRTFTGDIKYFLTLLESRGFLDTSYYLQNIGAGTEAFTANSARFQTISYQVKIV